MLRREKSRFNELRTKIEAKKSDELNRMREEVSKLIQERDDIRVNHAELQSQIRSLSEQLKESQDSMTAWQVLKHQKLVFHFNLWRLNPKKSGYYRAGLGFS